MLVRNIPSGATTLKIHHQETVRRRRRRHLERARRKQQAEAKPAQARQHCLRAVAAAAAVASMCVYTVAKTVHLDLDCQAIFDGTKHAKKQQQTSLRRDVERRQPDRRTLTLCVCVSIEY